MSETFDLDRETNIQNNIDAQGKKWVIHKDRTNHLLYVRPEPDRVDAVIPKKLAGKWTKMMLLKEQIELYIKESWDRADAIAEKNRRRAEAAKEAVRGRKDETAEEGREAKEDHNEEPAGGPDDTRSKEEKEESKEEEVLSSFETMPYDQLLALAKEMGITERKKAKIIEALTKAED